MSNLATPLFVHPNEWAYLQEVGFDMTQFRLIEPIPKSGESVSLNNTLTPMLPIGSAATARR